jgi:hypothetical protein
MIDTTLGIEIGEPLQCADEELAALRIARLIAMRANTAGVPGRITARAGELIQRLYTAAAHDQTQPRH